ncbi:unnamed protein product [Candidula unifasciata]|uniref:RNA ligase domain-containing protein n=1 Tax=Candidula unifasciata TaxID=100452 RepID=A0A8S4A889_9EUPU|nr:unnamed protein product [Candidula unifasciata]
MTTWNAKMQFVPMTTINKKATHREIGCSDWVATEKIHGSSFQFFTNNGENVSLASRRTLLDCKGSFLKCNMKEFQQRHLEFVKLMYQTVETEDRWRHYRTTLDMVDDDSDDKVEDGNGEDSTENKRHLESQETAPNDINEDETNVKLHQTEIENGEKNVLELRIYGEIYGGGGINIDIKSAVQKEIIYSDEFRFYVFGVNINRKWVTVTEMNDLCQTAGFPYYALPLCPPKSTLEELTQFLITDGIMKSKSRLTDKTDNNDIIIEGVVMTPLKRPDFHFHAIKLLSSAFNDVRAVGIGKNRTVSYCTKARYNNIIKEGGESEVTERKKNAWTKCVKTWLTADGYIQGDEPRQRKCAKANPKSKGKQGNTNGDEKVKSKAQQLEDAGDDEGNELVGLFG